MISIITFYDVDGLKVPILLIMEALISETDVASEKEISMHL